MFNALHEIVSILQVILSFFVFNKPLEMPSYIPHFSQYKLSIIMTFQYLSLRRLDYATLYGGTGTP